MRKLSNYLAKAEKKIGKNNELKDIVEIFWNRKTSSTSFCIKILVLYVGKRDYEML